MSPSLPAACRTLCLFLALFLLPALAGAHKPETSYLYLTIRKEQIVGRVEINDADLERVLKVELPENPTEEDLAPYLDRIHAYITERVRLSSGTKRYRLDWTKTEVLDLDEAEYDYNVGRFYYTLAGLDGAVPDDLDIQYTILFDEHREHNGAVIIDQNWKAGIISNETNLSATFNPSSTTTSLDLTDGSVWTGFWAMVKSGMWHIYIGLDHILFIVALILPSVVRRKKNVLPSAEITSKKDGNQWVPVPNFKEAFFTILKVVTSFTIAHSITLSLAALDIVTLPGRPVETIIAFSIALAAFHNIYPLWNAREWIIAFVFGLFHGFGFASVMADLGLSNDYMAYTILGFNVGVEFGQVLIILAIFPLLFLIRKWKYYGHFVFWGSAFLILISMQWVIERGFDFNIRFFDIFKNLFG